MKFRNFLKDEGGAVTVDWVLITAAVVGLGWLMYLYLNDPIKGMDQKTGTALTNAQVAPIVYKN